MKNNQTRKIALLAVITALSIVLGNFFKIPTPTGFLTLLDAGIYFTAFILVVRKEPWLGACLVS